MEKRLFLAVFLSIAFLFGWGALAPRIFPGLRQAPPEPAATTTIAQGETGLPPSDTAQPATPQPSIGPTWSWSSITPAIAEKRW